MPSSSEPPRLAFGDPGSFAARTLRERLPKIVDLVDVELRESALIGGRLAELKRSLAGGKPPETLGRDEEERRVWEELLREYRGAPWLGLPFFEGEFVFYRAILDAIEYDGAESARDPFGDAKRAALDGAEGMFERAAREVVELRHWDLDSLRRAIEWALRGNTADLSHFVVRNAGPRRPLIDDASAFFDGIPVEAAGRIEFVLDNAGEELIGDLVFISYLLQALPRVTLRAHAKPVPIFVSDVTVHDFETTLNRLCDHGTREVADFGQLLCGYRSSGRLLLSTDAFWARPLCFFQMSGALREQFSAATACIIKGDLNYRRYVEDRAWPLDSPSERHRVSELAPALALRVLKSELLVGLPELTGAALLANEPDALYSGRNTVIQYFR